jgi:cob(I)alamin adenosyltransferase
LLHLARTVCRRAERWIVSLRHRETINEAGLRFFNRLGDYLFAAARVVNGEEEIEEERA